MASKALKRLAALLVLAAPVAAPGQQYMAPQKDYYIGEGDVELYSGVFTYNNVDFTTGPTEGDGGFELKRFAGIRDTGAASTSFGPDNGHSLEFAVYRETYKYAGEWQQNQRYYVLLGSSIQNTFEEPYGYTQIINRPEYRNRLIHTGTSINGPYEYTMGDGTIINFAAYTPCAQIGIKGGCGAASSIVKPNGSTTYFSYDIVSLAPRLRLVTNNRGFGIGFVYSTSTSRYVTKVCAVNLAYTYVTASAPCPAGVRAATYGYSTETTPRLLTYTDPASNTTSFTYDPAAGGIGTIRNPGDATNDLTIAYGATSFKVTSQTNASGATWTYTYQDNFPWYEQHGNMWTDVKDPLNHTTRHNFTSFASPKPGSVTDPLSRTTAFVWKQTQTIPLERKTEPEGNYVLNIYGLRDNQAEERRVAKAGSGLADIVTSWAGYPATCTNAKTCNQPASKTDPRGGVTDYTYDPTHGGVLTETGPAVNGIRPVKRYTYAQRYAWIKNSGGTYVQAASPVWLLTDERTCKTTATSGTTCAGGASDQVTTTYDYGPNSGPNNLLLRGMVVDSGGLNLRTCYSYDKDGNRISESKPRAGLGTCP